MRSAIIIVGGLVLLVLALVVARMNSVEPHSLDTIARVFVLVWLAVAVINTWIGVARAGYSVAEEFPIFLVIFIIPAAAASLVVWKFS